jgi:hypothetical protein
VKSNTQPNHPRPRQPDGVLLAWGCGLPCMQQLQYRGGRGGTRTGSRRGRRRLGPASGARPRLPQPLLDLPRAVRIGSARNGRRHRARRCNVRTRRSVSNDDGGERGASD